MKKSTFRLLSLFMVMFTMSQSAHSSQIIDWLSDFINDYYNDPENGQLCYSKVNAKSGIGAGKVYVEWAKANVDYSADYVREHLITSEVSEQSPNDNTAKKARSASNTTHKWVFCAAGDNGWEFEGVYDDENFSTPHSMASETHDGIFVGKLEIVTSATSSNNQPVVNLFARFSKIVTLNKYGYSTLYWSNYNFQVPSGVTATTYKLDSDNKLVVSTEYTEDDVIPAGEAVVLQGTANEDYLFMPVKGTYTPDANNLLKGSDEAATTVGNGKFYALSAKGGKVGFYWMVDGGGAFTNGAHKAYLLLPSSDVKSYTFEEDDATGIETIESAVEDGAIYNVAGQRVGKMQKGINIVNGKKILKK